LRQIAIYLAIDRIPGWHEQAWWPPDYAHVGLIHKDKKKMSKRDGAASLLDYRDKGYDPDAVLNYLLRLGWGPFKDDKNAQYIPKDKALSWFLTEGKMRAPSSNFDQAKLDWLDRKYKALKGKKNGNMV
jgi:glutamyl-tRNA synthetase